MNAINWKQWLPHAAVIAAFMAIGLTYFSPVFEGKRLVQGDKKHWQGMAQEVVEHREAFDEEPLWTGSMFSGMPAYQISVQWTQNALRYVDALFHAFLPKPASYLFLYLLGMYILLQCLKIDPWLSLLGAIAFAFSSYFFVILEAGHNSKANAVGYLPPTLGAFWLIYRGRALVGAALFALFLGLEVMMNHVQITYYFGFVLLFFVLAESWRSIQEKRVADFLKRTGMAVGAGALALLCNTGLLWSTAEYGKYTTRGPSELTLNPDGTSNADNKTTGLDKDYVTNWSYGKQETFTLLVPNAKGGASGSLIQSQEDLNNIKDTAFRNAVLKKYQARGYVNNYWGDQDFTSGPVYLGAIIVLLMLLMLARAEGPARWWILGSLLVILALLKITSPVLAGVLVIGYLLAGIFLWKDVLAYALFSGLLLTMLLSWGDNSMPLTDFFLDHVPGYDKFRAVTILLVVVELCAPVLAVLYLDRLIREGGWDKMTERRFLIPAGVLALVLVAFAVAPETFFNFISDRERDSFTAQADGQPNAEAEVIAYAEGLKDLRAGVFTEDVWRSLLFVLAAGALVFFFGRKKITRVPFLAGLGLLVFIDQWSVDKRFVNNEKDDRGRYLAWEDDSDARIPYKATKADVEILRAEENAASKEDFQQALARLKESKQGESGRNKLVSPDEELLTRFGSLRRNSHYRVLALGDPFNDPRASYYHKSIGGYHGAKLKRYQELIMFHIYPEIGEVQGLLQSGTTLPALDSVLARQPVLNMLNMKYLIRDPAQPPVRNLHAMGAGWFADEVKWVKNADEEIMALGQIDPARTVVIDERFRGELGEGAITPDPSAEVTLDGYRANEMKYTVRSGGGVAVFSEIWYGPDWQATIDGQPAPYARANYVLRAMRVPAGEHQVVFTLKSRPYDLGGTISMAGSWLLILMVLGALGWDRFRSRTAAA